MTNKLAKKEETTLIDKQFEDEINQATDYIPPVFARAIKFHSKEGKFYRHLGEFEEDGQKKWEAMEEKELPIHIINAGRHIVSTSTMDPSITEHYYSPETPKFLIDIYKKDTKEYVETMSISEAKRKYHTKMSTVVYLYYQDEAYKMYLSGGKVGAIINFLKAGNPVYAETIMSVGQKYKTPYGELYNLVFRKGKKMDREVVKNRADNLIEYFKSINSDVLPTEPEDEEESVEINGVAVKGKEIKIDEVPFGDNNKADTLLEAEKHLNP